jgi:neutral ceramidase
MRMLALLALMLLPGVVSAALRAGAAVHDITPHQWPVPLVGSFSNRQATKAWDPLHARALVLEDGKTALGIVLVDSCYLPRELLDKAKKQASKRTGLRTDHLLIAATHTHSAPPSRDLRHIEVKAVASYLEQLQEGIVKAIEKARANLQPAEVGWGVTNVPEEVFNRRWHMKPGGIPVNPFGEQTDQVRMNPPRGSALLLRPAGPTDPEVVFLSVRTAKGRPLALLANYSLHYVGGVPAGGVSADYFGEFANQIEKRLLPAGKQTSPPFVGILSNGTSGDINNINFRNPRPRREPFEQIRKVASRVADAIFEVYPKVRHQSNVTLAMAQAELTLKVRKPTEQQIARARAFLAETDENKLPRRAKAYARMTLFQARRPATEALVLQALRIGDVGIAAIPCEVFVEIGLKIKKESPLKPTFTIELANGHYGYLPTPRQHRLGGYETWLGTNQLEINASDKITAEVLELLRKVAAKTPSP